MDFITQKYEICHTSAKLSPQAHFLLPLIAPVNLPLILLSPFSQALKQMFPFFISSLSKSTISYQGEKLPSLLRGEPFLCLALPHLLPLPPGCQGFRFLPGLSHSWIILTLNFYKGWFSLTTGEFLQGVLGIVWRNLEIFLVFIFRKLFEQFITFHCVHPPGQFVRHSLLLWREN